MKKRIAGKKMSRSAGSRRALKRSLIRALVQYGSIRTTKSKAKFVISDAEKLVNAAKKGDLAGIRRVHAATENDRMVTQRIVEISKVYVGQNGGYLRIVPTDIRKGDNAQMVRVEWTKQTIVPVTVAKPAKKAKKSVKAVEPVEKKKSGLAARFKRPKTKAKTDKKETRKLN